MDKPALRRELLSRLRALTAEERAARSASLRAALANDPWLRRARTVFAYLALPLEPDLAPLVGAIPGQRWAFPHVVGDGPLSFHLLPHAAEATPGALGILQPDPSRHPLVPVGEADLVLVPGLGFDPATRARLGRGKGHYDRFLSAALASTEPPGIVGVAFSEQLGPVPVEAHDVPMQRLLTDRGWI